MFGGQESVAVGITDGNKRIAAYIGGSIDEVINKLSEAFDGNIAFMQEEELESMQNYAAQ